MRLVLVDSNEPARRSLAQFLSLQPGLEIVGEASSRCEAARAAGVLRPDLVILDCGAHPNHCAASIRDILKQAPQAAVIILAVRFDEQSRRAVLAAGARACIEMGAGVDDLVEAVRRLR